jgi:hypothetical protein
MYSRNVTNLFLTGRLISATHIAFGSTRVMATCAHNAQAVGMAAVLCHREKLLPRDLLSDGRIHQLQQSLLRTGQFIPGVIAKDETDLAQQSCVSASSTLELHTLHPNGTFARLDKPMAMLLPLSQGRLPVFTLTLRSECSTIVRAELWGSERRGNTTPDVFLADCEVAISRGEADQCFLFDVELADSDYIFLTLHPRSGVEIALSSDQITGLLAVSQSMNKAVANDIVQTPPEGMGIDTFAFWLPQRRPMTSVWAMQITPALKAFTPSNVINGIARPWTSVNAWLPAMPDKDPWLKLSWPTRQSIRRIEITFDTDFDHPMESVLIEHSERVMPACITSFDVYSAGGSILAHVAENHQTRWRLTLAEPVMTDELVIAVRSHGDAVPAIFEVRCY